MEQLRSSFIQALTQWNKTHRLIGAKPAEVLVQESEEALRSLPKLASARALIDVGAGGGILGIPYLWIGPAQSSIGLIEPDLKKSSFLIHLRSTLPEALKKRVHILQNRLQDVPRETVDGFAQPDQRVFVARAFSGEVDLAQAIQESPFAREHFYTFCDSGVGKSPRFVLEAVKI